MREHAVETVDQLLTLCSGLHNGRGTLYRGVSKYDYDLRPAVGRYPRWESRLDQLQRDMMFIFRVQGMPHCQRAPADEWEWLAMAQHHGVPTALLDWSRNPLVASFFAVENDLTHDGAVYVLQAPSFLRDSTVAPSACTEVVTVVPNHVTPRLTAQTGLFTFHPRPTEAYAPDSLQKIRIPVGLKAEALERLATYGVHAAALFPGLDGLGRYIRWLKGI